MLGMFFFIGLNFQLTQYYIMSGSTVQYEAKLSLYHLLGDVNEKQRNFFKSIAN